MSPIVFNILLLVIVAGIVLYGCLKHNIFAFVLIATIPVLLAEIGSDFIKTKVSDPQLPTHEESQPNELTSNSRVQKKVGQFVLQGESISIASIESFAAECV